MVSIEEARELIARHCGRMDVAIISIDQSVGRVLAENVDSPIDVPDFNQSAMDGFAMSRHVLDNGQREFRVVGEVQAGRASKISVSTASCVSIFTGALVPDDCDIVIMQEHVDRNGDTIVVEKYSPDQKSNIRSKAEQLKAGDRAIEKGQKISAATVGFLASLGFTNVPVYKHPRIAFLATGNELRKPGEDLQPGEIYESNSFALESALKADGFELSTSVNIADDLEATGEMMSDLLDKHDVLIISGGISVGKYDYVKRALESNGVEEVFYKIKQKPGKPMYFGKGEALVFALPGNPASMLVCYYQYVRAALNFMCGGEFELPVRSYPLAHDFSYPGARPEFFRSRVDGEGVHILEGQGSSVLKSFAEADSLTYIQGENRMISSGELVEVYPII
jgi:molybdopterin molybdotransferase